MRARGVTTTRPALLLLAPPAPSWMTERDGEARGEGLCQPEAIPDIPGLKSYRQGLMETWRTCLAPDRRADLLLISPLSPVGPSTSPSSASLSSAAGSLKLFVMKSERQRALPGMSSGSVKRGGGTPAAENEVLRCLAGGLGSCGLGVRPLGGTAGTEMWGSKSKPSPSASSTEERVRSRSGNLSRSAGAGFTSGERGLPAAWSRSILSLVPPAAAPGVDMAPGGLSPPQVPSPPLLDATSGAPE